jgi:flagellar biosynthesis activator protein FlaF
MQQHAANAYGKTAKQSATPRELEASLLLKAASQLQAISDAWDHKKSGLNDALLYNRQLWTIFLADATQKENPLPVTIRQNVANLGLFVIKQTMSLMVNPQPQPLAPLININRELAAGLLARP